VITAALDGRGTGAGSPAAAGRPACLRASIATTSGEQLPAASAAVIPAITAGAGIRRCSSRTSISALVPAPSPCRARAAAQNASWAAVNVPAARACASAAAPGSAPGFLSSISR
jgi:hypothetical protein